MLLLAGAVLLAMGLGERPVRRLPVTPSLVYLGIGCVGAAAGTVFEPIDATRHAALLRPIAETAVLF